MKSPILTIMLSCLPLLTGCIIIHNRTSLEAFNQEIYSPEYASGFKILGAEDFASTLIQISNPWQGAKDVKMSYFVSRNGEQAPAGFNGPVIPAGAKQIVCMPSSYIAMLDALGEVGRIVGISGMDYIANPYILAHKNSIKDMGADMNYELLVGLKPDVVLLYGIGDAQTAVTDKLKELSIPYLYMGRIFGRVTARKSRMDDCPLRTDRQPGKRLGDISRNSPTLSCIESFNRFRRKTSHCHVQHSVERQLGNAFHSKLHGTTGYRRGSRVYL